MQVKFYGLDEIDDDLFKFAVIVARHNGKYVFCKHKERDTWELPGGHRENGESILQAAKRELYEETGATDFSIEPLCVYSVIGKTRVNQSGEETFGMLFFAEVKTFDSELHSEMEKIQFFESMPKEMTYPLIQPKLWEEAKRRGKILEADLPLRGKL